jgi:hypothetical protein
LQNLYIEIKLVLIAMDRCSHRFRFTSLSIYLISAILAFTIIDAVYITSSLAQTTGKYIEVKRIITIPKDKIPNSGNLTGDNSSSSSATSSPSTPIKPVVDNYQQISLFFM